MEPRVSVVIPAYLSQDTVGGCLEGLRRQTYRNFETVVVDSSPDPRTAAVAEAFPEIVFERSAERLLPHAARNRGVALSRGSLLVFTDPDVFPRAGWLANLVATHDATGDIAVSALACHGERWLDTGVHLCKFSKWLPGGRRRPVDNSPTAGMLVPRGVFEAVGGFRDDIFLSDALFSWEAVCRGATLHLDPTAVADHHHLSSLGGFLRERFGRGIEFGDLRSGWRRHGRGRDLVFLLVSLLPLRLPRILALTAVQCARGGALGAWLSTLPVIAAGHAASLLGESVAYGRRLVRRQPSPALGRSPAPHPEG